MPILGPKGPIYTETDPEYRECRSLIAQAGIVAEEPSVQLLGDALSARGWTWKMNEDDHIGGPGEFVLIDKTFATAHRYFAVKGTTPDVALTIALASAIQDDEDFGRCR
jgi:hypothetical protein